MKEIRRAIYDAKGKGLRSIIKKQAYLYMDLILETENLSVETGIPQSIFDLLVEILSVKELYEKPGMDGFMVGMATDAVWLSADQKSLMYAAMLANYGGYGREEFCWTICDFIARQFPFEKAMDFFEAVSDSATDNGRQGIRLGLSVLSRYAGNDPGKERRMASLLTSIKNT